jgi:ATP-binding cassette subfamily B (MDR/TAP) protein 1
VAVLSSRLSKSSSAAYAEANTISQQALGNVRTVAAFNGGDRVVRSYSAALDWPLKAGIQQGLMQGFTLGAVNGIWFLSYAAAMYYGAVLVSQQKVGGGDVLNVVFAAIIGGFALGQAAPSLQYFRLGCVAGASLFHTIALAPEIDLDAPGKELEAVEGHLELKHVSFAYPARPDKRVFDDFSLVVPAGATVALVGESGSGKSTVVSLIQRFYDPQAGSITLDGFDLRALQLRWLRSRMGLVSQEPTLFATSILDNIKYGNERATLEEVRAAAKAANAHAFVSGLPAGYATQVGEKGVQMSGGQKQRIAIARAILRNPRVLLLDEATSALDSESERLVQDALDGLMAGRTTVVVAHRLSTVINADSIAVVRQGAVVEMGSHEELIKNRDGAYSTLIASQQSLGDGGDGDAPEEAAADAGPADSALIAEAVRRASLDGHPVKATADEVRRCVRARRQASHAFCTNASNDGAWGDDQLPAPSRSSALRHSSNYLCAPRRWRRGRRRARRPKRRRSRSPAC